MFETAGDSLTLSAAEDGHMTEDEGKTSSCCNYANVGADGASPKSVVTGDRFTLSLESSSAGDRPTFAYG